MEQSQADTIILLGDLPIKYFLSHFSKFKKLSDFGTDQQGYGNQHPIIIRGKTYQVIPLVHPRQAGNLGRSSQNWSDLHKKWVLDRKGQNPSR